MNNKRYHNTKPREKFNKSLYTCSKKARGKASIARSMMEKHKIRDPRVYKKLSEIIHCQNTHEDCPKTKSALNDLDTYLPDDY